MKQPPTPLEGYMQTNGISPKAALAFLLPAIGTLILALLDQVIGPDMDPTVKIAIVGLVTSILAFAGAWAGKPGVIVDQAHEELDLHDAPGA